MEKKYYTPNLEDFYEGYEYEIWYNFAYTLEEWKKQIYHIRVEEGLEYTNKHIDALIGWECLGDKIRTKYLDKEDIESCGWKQCITSDYMWKKVIPVEDLKERGYMYSKGPEYLYLELNNYKENYNIIIHNNDTYEEYTQWFKGECKSINELYKIMKMLNIKK